ncbi:hypothetical protein D3C78_1188090 [compost metagenome]
MAHHGLQSRSGSHVGVLEDWRGSCPGFRAISHRQHVHRIPSLTVAFRASNRLLGLWVVFRESRPEEAHDRNVEAIQPYHRLPTFAAGPVAMVVPSPGWGDDKVTRFHLRALAIDCGIGALALDDKAQRRLTVSMAGRDLAGQNQLQSRIEAGGDRRLPADGRILQHQHSTNSFCRADQTCRFGHQPTHFAVAPERWRAFRPGLFQYQIVKLLPQRKHVLLVKLPGKGGTICRDVIASHSCVPSW